MRTFFTIFILVCIVFGAFANGQQEAVPQETPDGYMSVEVDDIQVRWKVEGENLNFEISAPTTGWISIGFDPTRVMKDANFVIGYVEGGSVVVSDHFGTGTFSHKDDEELGGSHDIVQAAGREEGGRTIIEFTVPIDSGDQYDTVLTPGEVHTVLIAYGPDGADNFSKKHAKRMKVDVTL